MANYNTCKKCGAPLFADDIAIHRKLIFRNADEFFCIDCLAEYFGCTRNDVEEQTLPIMNFRKRLLFVLFMHLCDFFFKSFIALGYVIYIRHSLFHWTDIIAAAVDYFLRQRFIAA